MVCVALFLVIGIVGTGIAGKELHYTIYLQPNGRLWCLLGFSAIAMIN